MPTRPQGSPRSRPRRHEAQLRRGRRHTAPAGHQCDASVDGGRLDPHQQRRVQRRAGSGARRLRCWPLCFRPLCCCPLCRCPVCHCRADASAIYTIWCVWGANDWRRVQILVSSNFLSEIFIIVRIPDLATSTQLLCVCRPETDAASGWRKDHSISTEEAKTSRGDLLWRWGNPANYGQNAPQVLFGQHNAHWIPEGCEGARSARSWL